jgi:hypothetical protein
MNYIKVSITALGVSILGIADLFTGGKSSTFSDPALLITLIASIVAILVSISGAVVIVMRSKHQDSSDDAGAVRSSQESADLASAARLKLEIRVAAQDQTIELLQRQLLDKGPIYAVSFVLHTGGENPVLEKIEINKLAKLEQQKKDIILDKG